MHEGAIAESLIALASEAVAGKAGRITALTVEIGALSSISPESLLFVFDALKAGTPCAGAGLACTRIPLLVRCRDCRAETRIEKPLFRCPACGGNRLEILSGRELALAAVELSED